MKSLLSSVIIFTLIIFLPVNSNSYPNIGPFQFEAGGGGFNMSAPWPGFNTASFYIEALEPGHGHPNTIELFQFNTSDIGKTFILNSGPLFEAAVVALTDGKTDYLILEYSQASGGGYGESLLFYDYGTTPIPGMIDLEGFTISSISFRLDELYGTSGFDGQYYFFDGYTSGELWIDFSKPITNMTFCGVTTINRIGLSQSDSKDFPIAPCELEIVFTMDNNSIYTVPVTAFGTQLNLALLMAFDERKSFWGCLDVILYPFKARVISAGFW